MKRWPAWKYYALRLAEAVLPRLPLSVGHSAADFFGEFAYRVARSSRTNLEANVRQALGESADGQAVRRTTRNAFRNLSRNYYDLMRIPRLSPRQLGEMIEVVGLEHLERAREHGRGAITATAHLGNVDLVPQAALVKSIPLMILVELFEPRRLWDHWMKLRGGQGLTFAPANASGIKLAYRALSRGEVVGIACDRAVHGQSLERPFMGVPTLMPMGAAEMALRTGASLVPVFCLRDGADRYKLCLEPAIEVAKTNGDAGYTGRDVMALADEMIKVMERYIRDHLEQWMLFQPLWPTLGLPR
ncbi:hypothetical protein M1O29_00725 [Dehalococcoidia bacterium]|nr:hypothetical protein [Dehalococcoidia bacterium]